MYFKLKDDGIINFELLGKAISNDIKLVYFVNPNNPTGLAYPIDELNEMIKEKLDTYFLIDEAYSDFWGHTMVDSINEHINVIVTKRQSSKGGSLFVPEYNACFEQADNSLLVYPAWRNMHGVTPIIPTQTGGYRNSLIFYPLKAMNQGK